MFSETPSFCFKCIDMKDPFLDFLTLRCVWKFAESFKLAVRSVVERIPYPHATHACTQTCLWIYPSNVTFGNLL